jgi:hypothetical protein
MSRELQTRQHDQAVAAPTTAISDPFTAILTPARPTLDAVAHLKPALDLLVKLQRRAVVGLDLKDPVRSIDEAERRLELIPPLSTLRQAAQLFEDARRIPAPAAWLHLAVGAMLAGMPNSANVSPFYRMGIVDSMLHDEEFAPGFSAPVVIRAMRELRKATKFVPAPAELFDACKAQAQFLGEMRICTEQLASIRENAEAVVAEFNRKFEEDFGPDDERTETNRPVGRPPEYPADNSDVPF